VDHPCARLGWLYGVTNRATGPDNLPAFDEALDLDTACGDDRWNAIVLLAHAARTKSPISAPAAFNRAELALHRAAHARSLTAFFAMSKARLDSLDGELDTAITHATVAAGGFRAIGATRAVGLATTSVTDALDVRQHEGDDERIEHLLRALV